MGISEDDIAVVAATIRRAEVHLRRGQGLLDEAARLLVSYLPDTVEED